VENKIRFIEGMNMGEDMMVMIKLFVCAKKVGIIHIPFPKLYCVLPLPPGFLHGAGYGL